MRSLKGIRSEMNWDQIDMAKYLGLNISTYQNKEKGNSDLKFTEAKKVIELVRKNIDPNFDIFDLKI